PARAASGRVGWPLPRRLAESSGFARAPGLHGFRSCLLAGSGRRPQRIFCLWGQCSRRDRLCQATVLRVWKV
ncbi:unnamed protein product, partial [Gulo gulo]